MEVNEEWKISAQEVPPVKTEEVQTTTCNEKYINIINKIGDYLKIPLMKILDCSAFFICIYLAAWYLNATNPNFHFDLTALKDFYILVIGKEAFQHGVNSMFNSNKGEMPK